MLVISCHSDTGFISQSLSRLENNIFHGHLDNFSGVYAVMKAYFSGKLYQDYIHIEFTWGEETDMEGAYELLKHLEKDDLVLVVDVTGTPTQKDIVIEKCKNPILKEFLYESLEGISFDLYEYCPDPVSIYDEVDVYSINCPYVCFLGIPCTGGDYNEGKVFCTEQSIESLAQAICKIAENYPSFLKKAGIKNS
ncbi:MAG: hypothetical protein HUU50_22965 [Candidatus Brocadiae bacterium]|nr:hypothetical protein [Candidatus Brocadiia bacterium]